MNVDLRPAAAVGHVFLSASDVPAASARLEAIGLRPIVVREQLAVIEMRGGTHIVLRRHDQPGSFSASFDLMYDDLELARTKLEAAGFVISPVQHGGIHSQFRATAPELFEIKVVSSHAGQRPV